jgi:2-dehydro-3-deoxygluconokinase
MRIVSIGECMIELSAEPDRPGTWRQAFAGDTFNTAWHLRRQMPDWSVDYLTALGDDRFSVEMAGWMDRQGIGTRHVQVVPGRTPGLYTIALHDGERSFTYWRQDSAARRLADSPVVLADALDGADAAYLSGITLAILPPEGRRTLLAALVRARQAGTRIAFDSNIRPRLWESPEAMARMLAEAAATSDILLPSFDDERAAFGDASPDITAHRYAGWGASEVIVKNGHEAVTTLTNGHLQQHRGRVLRVPVDTTGAGDSFNAGYLAARLRGAEVFEAVARARFLAEEVIMYRGALPPEAR